jgi:hypothetical protein
MPNKSFAPLLFSMLPLMSLLLAGEAAATPKIGSRELRLGQQYQYPFLGTSNGFFAVDGDSGSGTTTLGAAAGMGWFVTDRFEVGATLNLQISELFGSRVVAPGVEPFLRFLQMSGRTMFFAELAAGAQLYSFRNDSTTLIDFGADVGVEFFVTDDWSVRLSPSFRRYVSTESSSGVNRFGVAWGLAAYF